MLVDVLYVDLGDEVGHDALRGLEALRHTFTMVSLYSSDDFTAIYRNPSALRDQTPTPKLRKLLARAEHNSDMVEVGTFYFPCLIFYYAFLPPPPQTNFFFASFSRSRFLSFSFLFISFLTLNRNNVFRFLTGMKSK